MINDAYEGGVVTLSNGKTFDIVGSTRNTIIISSRQPLTQQERALLQQPNTFVIEDDDETGLLPNEVLLTEEINVKFRPAFIELIDANRELPDLTPRRRVDFELNTPANAGSYLVAAKELLDEPWFWVQSLIAAYQPHFEADLDPDGRNPGYSKPFDGEQGIAEDAWTRDSLKASVLFLETMHDGSANEHNYRYYLAATIAHETGHGPGANNDEKADHKEGQLMSERNREEHFAPVTFARFRKTSSWYGRLVR